MRANVVTSTERVAVVETIQNRRGERASGKVTRKMVPILDWRSNVESWVAVKVNALKENASTEITRRFQSEPAGYDNIEIFESSPLALGCLLVERKSLMESKVANCADFCLISPAPLHTAKFSAVFHSRQFFSAIMAGTAFRAL